MIMARHCWVCHSPTKWQTMSRVGWEGVKHCLRPQSRSWASSHGVCHHGYQGPEKSQDANAPLGPPSGSVVSCSIPISGSPPLPTLAPHSDHFEDGLLHSAFNFQLTAFLETLHSISGSTMTSLWLRPSHMHLCPRCFHLNCEELVTKCGVYIV